MNFIFPNGPWYRIRVGWLPVLPEAAPGGCHRGFGGGAVGPGRALDALARLELLIDEKEVLDLEPVEFGQVMQVAQVFLTRVVRGHAEDLVVAVLSSSA